jgi:hypothetical protein
MSYSDDPATPAAPFTGDGSVFDQPDVVLTLPTTTERVVDTQSGFLLVVRRLGDRLVLACKRRVGTPPSSAILLTPDESVKLSKVLAASLNGLEDSAGSGSSSAATTGGRRRLPFSAPQQRRGGMLERLRLIVLPVLAVGSVFTAGLFTARLTDHSTKPAAAPAAPVSGLASANIDKFARSFVAEMLDFNPETYRSSQLRAMAAMSPELVDKYAQETNFPLTPAQLKKLPQGTTVVVDRIDQQRTGPDTAMVEISAQLVHTDSKLASPVKLKLNLALDAEGAIQVTNQADLSGSAGQ